MAQVEQNTESWPILASAALAADLRDVCGRWLRWLEGSRRLSACSLIAYERDLRQFLVFQAAHRGGILAVADLESLSLGEVRAFFAQRAAMGVSVASRARAISALRTFCSWYDQDKGTALTSRIIPKSPRRPRRMPRPLTQEQTSALLGEVLYTTSHEKATWEELRDQALCLLLYGCGLRIGEALLLDVQALAQESLRVTGKGGRLRLLPILPEVRAALEVYMEARTTARGTPSAPEPLFIGRRGGRMSPRHLQRRFALWRARLGLAPTASPHALRHSFSSHLLQAGADLRSIQELLGHRSLVTTQGYLGLETAHLRTRLTQLHPRADFDPPPKNGTPKAPPQDAS